MYLLDKLDKKVVVDGHDYDLSIRNIGENYVITLWIDYSRNVFYQHTFYNLSTLKYNLKYWIVYCHKRNQGNEKKLFIEELKEWDGVIEI